MAEIPKEPKPSDTTAPEGAKILPFPERSKPVYSRMEVLDGWLEDQYNTLRFNGKFSDEPLEVTQNNLYADGLGTIEATWFNRDAQYGPLNKPLVDVKRLQESDNNTIAIRYRVIKNPFSKEDGLSLLKLVIDDSGKETWISFDDTKEVEQELKILFDSVESTE